MKPLLIVYATREGQAEHIARRIAVQARARGLAVDLWNAARISSAVSLDSYSATILIASVHLGRHETEMRRFAARHARELSAMPSAFLSVSLSQAGAEDPSAPAERRSQAVSDANRMIDAFLQESRWRPSRIKAVAGALRYSKYNPLLRFAMRRIARKVGAPDDVSKDYEYTDWQELDSFAAECFQSWMHEEMTRSEARQ